MKKTILSLLSLTLAATTMACHPVPQGFCTGNAYFNIVGSHPGYQFEWQYLGNGIMKDTVITTPDTSIILISIPQPNQNEPVNIITRYSGGVGMPWSNWQTVASLTTIDESICAHVLPVTFNNVTASKTGNILNVSFDANEPGISYYEIQGSNDGASFEDIGRIQATGASHYSMSINLLSGVAIASLFFIGFKKKWLFWVSLLLCIGYFSCKKEMGTTAKNYNEFRFAAHTFDNNIQYSNVIHLTK